MENGVPNKLIKENSPNEARIRREPISMRDYESGQGISEEEDME